MMRRLAKGSKHGAGPRSKSESKTCPHGLKHRLPHPCSPNQKLAFLQSNLKWRGRVTLCPACATAASGIRNSSTGSVAGIAILGANIVVGVAFDGTWRHVGRCCARRVRLRRRAHAPSRSLRTRIGPGPASSAIPVAAGMRMVGCTFLEPLRNWSARHLRPKPSAQGHRASAMFWWLNMGTRMVGKVTCV